jgi:D-arginine dehydrogenase
VAVDRIAVIGGGIAGASAAHQLAEANPDVDVLLLEAEPHLAYHTTGRSAALLLENYGTPANRALCAAGLPFLREPPDGLVDAPLLTHRRVLHVGGPDQGGAIDQMLAEGQSATTPSVEVGADEAVRLFPLLRRERIERGILEPDGADIDVGALHQAFIRGFRRAGGRIAVATRVDAARPDGDGWRLDTTDGDVLAGLVVNAAGAWGDVVARGAGVEPIGLQPLRRTAFMVNGPGVDTTGWAFTADVEHAWYMRDDGEQMLCSLANETPSEPCDAKPEELEVALAIERINEATTLGIRSVNSAWAGLRTFARDRSIVIGPDPDHQTFIWCVGQGGTGIQTSPGAGRLVADLAFGGGPSSYFADVDLDLPGLLPDRLPGRGGL